MITKTETQRSSLNIELFDRIKTYIRKEPRRMNMKRGLVVYDLEREEESFDLRLTISESYI